MSSTFLDILAKRNLVRDVMVRLNLIEPGETIGVEVLAGGVSSTILKIRGQSGTYCLKQALPLLKVAKSWSAPVERIYAEIAWLQLAARIIPDCVPKVLGVDRSTNSFVMTFLPPDDFPNWKSELLGGRINVLFAASVGATLARIHCATANQEEIERRFSNDDSFWALRLDPYLLETARRHPDLSIALHALVARTQTKKLALVHGDVSPKNILVSPVGPIFLDAECAWYGDPAFDVAFCLSHILLKSVAVRNSSAFLLDAFDAFADAYLSSVNWEPRQDIESRVVALLPALALARVSGKSPIEYLDQSMRETIITITKPLVVGPSTRLEALRSHWKRGFDL
jgi:aminoglycoside phosphotransferase (APT) family kinase protein